MVILINQHGRQDFLVCERISFKRYIYILFISVDIYDLCAATPDSHAERLYEETKKFLEDHCKFMKKVVYQIFVFAKYDQRFSI